MKANCLAASLNVPGFEMEPTKRFLDLAELCKRLHASGWIKDSFFLSARRGFCRMCVHVHAHTDPACSPGLILFVMALICAIHYAFLCIWNVAPLSRPLRSHTFPRLLTWLLRGPRKLITPSVASTRWQLHPHPSPKAPQGEKSMRHPPSAALKATAVSIGTDVRAIRYDASLDEPSSRGGLSEFCVLCVYLVYGACFSSQRKAAESRLHIWKGTPHSSSDQPLGCLKRRSVVTSTSVKTGGCCRPKRGFFGKF